MKTHGHYTAPGPPLPQLSLNAQLILTLVTLAIVGAGLLALIYRFGAEAALAARGPR